MNDIDVTRASAAAVFVAASLGLGAESVEVLHNSNKLALRLTPCDVLARVTWAANDLAGPELHRARRLAEASCPVGAVAAGIDPRVYPHDDFEVTLWAYYPPATPPVSPERYALALSELHAGMRTVDLPSPRFTDRLADALQVASNPDLSPGSLSCRP